VDTRHLAVGRTGPEKIAEKIADEERRTLE